MIDAILVSLIVIPLLAAFFLKSNGAAIFFSVCVGFVLVNLASKDVGNLLHANNVKSITPDTANLLLVFVPTAITLLLSRKQVKGHFRLVLSLTAAACAGGLMILTTAPFFNASLTSNLADSVIWQNTQKIQGLIIAVGALASFIFLWMGSSKKSDKKKK